jgi:hypothetical protein
MQTNFVKKKHPRNGNLQMLYLKNIDFLNLAFVMLQLRKFVKATTVDRFRKQVKQLIDAAERNADFVGRKRDAATFSPKDTAAAKSFLQVRVPASVPFCCPF